MVDPTTAAFGALAVLALLAASAFFSSTEIAIFSLSPEAAPGGDGDGSGGALAALRADPHRLLVTLLVGNNLVNVAISAVVTVLAAGLLPPGPAVVASTVVASTVVLVFGEIIPKSFGLGNAERWALATARPLLLVQAVLYPVVSVFDLATRRLGGAIGGSGDIETAYTD